MSNNLQSAPVRIGFIGCGRQARRSWYPNFVHLKDAVLVACCDLRADLAEATATEFGAKRWYTDAGRMIAEEQLDAVMVVGPPKMHYECTVQCLEAGLHTMTEKPLAPLTSMIEELAGVAQDKALVTQVGHNMRHAPMVQKARQIAASTEFGDLLYLESRYHMPSPEWTADGWPGWTVGEAPGGWLHLIEQGIHAIDLAQDLGGPIREVSTNRSRLGRDDRFALAASVTFSSGACGTIMLSAASANWSTKLELIGDGPGTLSLTNVNHLTYEPADPEAGYEPPFGVPARVWSTPTRDDSLRRLGYRPQMEAFVHAVRGDGPAGPTFADALASFRVAEAILESHASRTTVSL